MEQAIRLLTKVCSGCRAARPVGEFNKHVSGKSGLNPRCRACLSVSAAEWRARNPERSLKAACTRYGISVAEYRRLESEQDGRCAICRRPHTKGRGNRLHIDHDHGTGKVRGLLCGNCNFGIGHFSESLDLLAAAAAYLRQHG